eukprot:1321840-Amorphochlora_amoeboformis.AAC.1
MGNVVDLEEHLKRILKLCSGHGQRRGVSCVDLGVPVIGASGSFAFGGKSRQTWLFWDIIAKIA